ncbi:MAG: fumarylacetoacetate hydrolase family protein [Gammaproteobacteria bacterium]|nr:fumarylacetoacetate hydrolase family protein [Gammaproteobacteria bacterium]
MKLASLRNGRDGILIIVNRELSHYTTAPEIATRLQEVLDNWEQLAPQLQRVYDKLNRNKIDNARPLDTRALAAPLPRAYQWLDGSAYLSHVERVRKARGAEMPESFLTDPLMYQGASDSLLGPNDPIVAADEHWGIDFESEVAVITDDVSMGTSAGGAAKHIKLLALVNDVTLRNLIPAELAKGFGFLQGKPPTAFSPVAVTPDELGAAWRNCKLALPLETYLNGGKFGDPVAGDDMQFDFAQLIAHAARTRPLGAGTIIGSGTVSNHDESRGCSCIAERRLLEIIEHGEAHTPFLKFGDRVKIEMHDSNRRSIFGAIEQEVTPWTN